MTAEQPNYAATILNAGRELQRKVEVIETPAGPMLARPDGITTHSLEEKLPQPRTLRQTVSVDTPSSFVDYVKLFATEAIKPVVFADLKSRDAANLVAILDYHAAPDQPSWNQHKVTMPLRFARPFGEWYTKNRTQMNQAEFAAFVEDHIGQIAAPAGAKLHEMCLKFEATKAVEFKSHQRVQDGSVQLLYNEDVQGSPTSRDMKMPAEMTLQMPVFDDTPDVQVVAKIRYRIDGAKLVLWYELQTIEDIVDVARAAVAGEVATALAGVIRGVIYGRA